MNRRGFLWGAAAVTLGASAQSTPRTKLGIASTSFTGSGRDALAFLERCSALGAGGIQTTLNGNLLQLRAKAEQAGMFLEGMASLPRDGNLAAFEKSLQDAKSAGADVVRVASLSGRRYETFATREAWTQWKDQTLAAI